VWGRREDPGVVLSGDLGRPRWVAAAAGRSCPGVTGTGDPSTVRTSGVTHCDRSRRPLSADRVTLTRLDSRHTFPTGTERH